MTYSRGFTRFAWAVLAWNVLVVLWGAFVRATGSGAGCGSHWPLCNGEIVPRAQAVQTIIEFTHRVTSGVALIGVVILLVWAFRQFPRAHAVRLLATVSIILIFAEALLGAGLVLLRYVEKNASVGRAIYLSAHLANTQLLLGSLALMAWFSRQSAPARIHFSARGRWVLAGALLAGISGAIAALGDTLFPATSFREGVRQETMDAAHFLLRLRVLHPAIAICFAAAAAFLCGRELSHRQSPERSALGLWGLGLVAMQVTAGVVNVLLLAPVWMQIVHLFLANAIWIVLVLLALEPSADLHEPVPAPEFAGQSSH